MFFMVYLFLFLIIAGLAGVSCNPSPNYGAVGLVVAAGGGCGLLVCMGSSFLSMVLFLVYLGGMLVVFAYSIAFTMSSNSDNWENTSSFNLFTLALYSVYCIYTVFKEGLEDDLWITGVSFDNNMLVQENFMSMAFLYAEGGGFLVISSLALLVALLVVLMVVRGTTRGALRAV